MTLDLERRLFAQALELPADARVAWLDSNCPDPALRERVLALLAAHDAAGAPALEPIPAEFGNYRLLERIGSGAMGEVYLADQVAPVVRRVAIKIIRPGMATRETLARFATERQTLAMLSHPGIARILDAGETDQGQPYIVMEYVPGLPVTQYCENRSLPQRQRLELFAEICDAVNHAHQRGVIHRDLKPTNVLVSEVDGQPVPRIIDFGIAKLTAQVTPSDGAHTMIGHLIGTPNYMSPEQAALSPLTLDTRSDIFSLGVMFYELLTGSLPRAVDASVPPVELMRQLTDERPQPPSVRAAQAGRDIRTELDWIALKALEPDRAQRYATVAELAADVRRFLSDEPVLARPPTTWYLLRKYAIRHKGTSAAVVTLMASIVVFGAAMAVQSVELARQRDAARFEAQRAEASSEFMSLMLEEVGEDGQPLTAIELVDRGVELLNRQYDGDPRFVATMLLQMARRYMDLENSARQEQVLTRARAIALELEDHALLASADCALAHTLIEINQRDAARESLEEAEAALARLPDDEFRPRVDCLRARSEYARIEGDRVLSESLLVQARELLESTGNVRGLQYTAVLTDLGLVHFQAGELRQALEMNRLVADVLERNGRGGTMASVITLANQGTILLHGGQAAEALRLSKEATRRLHSATAKREVSSSNAAMAAPALLRLGRYDEAAAQLEPAISVAVAQGNLHWQAILKRMLAEANVDSDRSTAAALAADVRRIWQADPLQHSSRLRDLARVEAEIAIAAGDLQRAGTIIEEALSQAGYPGRQDATGLAGALRTSARIHLLAGDAARAEVDASAWLHVAEGRAIDAALSADVGEAHWLISRARLLRGSRDALESARAAIGPLRAGLGAGHPQVLEVEQMLAADLGGPGPEVQ